MKTIITIIRNLFYKLWVSPKAALITLLVLSLTNSFFLFFAWIVVYAFMYYGHEVYLATEDHSNYSRYTPYAEADLRYRDAIGPSFFKLMAICLAVFTGNFWLLPACFLIAYNSDIFDIYIRRGMRYVIIL